VPVAWVHDAKQIVDLRALTLPKDAQVRGNKGAAYVAFDTSTGVEAVAPLFEPQLKTLGLKADKASSFSSAYAAIVNFNKGGFTIGLNASNAGPGQTSASLINYGNVDLTQLPRTADASSMHQAPNTLGFVSAEPVEKVADFARAELIKDGWHAFTLPGSSTSSNSSLQTLQFIKNGVQLSAMVSKSSAQGGKTAVQYSVVMLFIDLPVHDNAQAVEFSRNANFLRYQSGESVATLAKFYTDKLTALGYNKMAVSEKTGAGSNTQSFAHQQEKVAMTLVLQPKGQGTLVELRPYKSN